ncbi:GMC oxidoreductase [Trichosporon asahii var. asahii CBS 2479]|uniref:GMC oxidoreductase n=1 Tax=Trichosporon asahii var. asahii (strain ATCC 90039 / CBS 2479 / JCM 2466 / KCTC 7840 / NBRC 103889/ NCYC 2677 / UAMH 7654) TaxID=1186058 RepID=J6ER25_TRIAS|nr:GMC oxidoreductase [Trichosporon asahii var. asahii CBS 2479]EJT46954.1 GMC oxidoreductase [Trichosporon asahii var. asahii CBS 2479]
MLAFAILWAFATAVVAAPAPNNNEERGLFDTTFDYVVVGGGTGGLAIASRLSEDPSVSVAVIEAGTYYQVSNFVFSSTPGADVLFAGSDPRDTNPLVDWNFVTTPQTGADNRRVHYARGKCLGGSSARNFMVYQRPDPGSLQMWADAVGDQSYTLGNWMPYFRKSVKFTPPRNDIRFPNASATFDAGAFDPAGGPLQVTYPNWGAPFSTWMKRGMSSNGLPQALDFNTGALTGHNWVTTTIDPSTMKRSSSETSFMTAAKRRPNFTVFQLTMAKRILFDDNKKAIGVQTGLGSVLKARKEVILSAGAFQSPQLLMVSGVGPAAQLQRLGIQVIADRPGVGQNLTDHVYVTPSYRVNVETYTKLANNLLYIVWEYLTNFVPFKRGVLTDPLATYLGWERVPANLVPSAQVQSDLNKFPSSWPHLEYMSAPGFIGDFSNLLTNQPKDGYQYASILAAVVAPLSRGTVSISSTDTNVAPLIDPAWLTHPTDQAVAIAGYKRVRQAFNSDGMAGLLADKNEYFPGSAVATDDQILATIRKTVMTVWHASCTCRMGRTDDPTAVVDNHARVIGVSGLRVVDASAFALLPPGHPQSVVYALAEKIAADIKSGH